MERRPCALCGEPAADECGKCRVAAYCSRRHQKEHWGVHKPTCLAAARAHGAVKEVTGFAGVLRATWGPEVVAGGAPDSVWSLAALGGGRVAVGHESGAIRIRDAATGR